MTNSLSRFSIGLLSLVFAIASMGAISAIEVSGLVIPRDQDGMYVRNDQGQFEVQWTSKTKVALIANTRLLRGLKADHLNYPIHSSKEIVTFAIPAGSVAAIKTSRSGRQFETELRQLNEEGWLSERGLKLIFDAGTPKEQFATESDPRFMGRWNPSTNPRTLFIRGKNYELSMRNGGQTTALLYNLLDVDDCKPFVNHATVLGRKDGDVMVADEIHLLPIGDQVALDDPDKLRYLFIGDSISGNYSRGLRDTLATRFNLHHPPTNCGSAANGSKNIVNWLGAYDQPNRHWDVISFNHGHWDVGKDKATYQRDLEKMVGELEKTGAKLVWVTTCPVPNGFPAAGDLVPGSNAMKSNAPGRKAGVMKKYLNPWALEVMNRHPEISICDQWQFVRDGDLYAEWWSNQNVHFGGTGADALGRFLGEHVDRVMKSSTDPAPVISTSGGK
ncbi:MAG: SGNH/GDSL hydrolase family protein [Rubripirellula sp.]